MKTWRKHLIPNAGSALLIALLLFTQNVIAGSNSQQGPQPAVAVQPVAPGAVNSPSSLLFSYQGQLTDAAGNPIPNAALPMTFKLYTVASGGSSFWTEIYTGTQAITVTNGLFNVLLGSLTPLNAAQLTGDVYLELTVNGERLSPRELLTSVAYAVEASTLAAGATTRGALTVPSNLTVNGKTYLNGNATVLAGSDPWGEGLNIDSPPDIWGGIKWRRTNRIGNAGNWHLGFDSTGDQKLHFNGEKYVMTLQQNGNVGIGTTAPAYPLDVNGAVRANRYQGLNSLVLNTPATVQPASNVYLYSPGNDRDSWLFLDSADSNSNWGIYHRQIDASVGDLPANSIGFMGGGGNAANAYISLANGNAFFRGNVGIGTSNPGRALVVGTNGGWWDSSGILVKGSNPGIELADTQTTPQRWIIGNGVTGANDGGWALAYDATAGAHRIVVLPSSGNVGIGTVSPSEKLQVNGNVKIDGSLLGGSIAGGYITVGQAGSGEGGEIYLQPGASGTGAPNGWNIDNYYGTYRLHHDGNTYFSVAPNGSVSCGALVEANLQTQDEKAAGQIDRFTEGDVLCWGIDQLELCAVSNDRLVQAVADASGKPIVIGAEKIKVLGPVQRGDYLVASDVPGYAVASANPTFGIVIAQALESFNGQRGTIKAMIRKM